MEKYKDRYNNSNIDNYEIGENFIIIEFKNGRNKFYKYTYESAGLNNIEKMKRLAQSGDGLNAFISINKPSYKSKS